MLVDIASRVSRGEPVGLAMGYVNVIWQGDANAFALAALAHAATPEPFVVNVTGTRDALASRRSRDALGARLGIDADVRRAARRRDALLSDASRMRDAARRRPCCRSTRCSTGSPTGSRDGGPLLGKPTNFEARDGRF